MRPVDRGETLGMSLRLHRERQRRGPGQTLGNLASEAFPLDTQAASVDLP